MPPTYGHGKICYLLIPATDVEASAAFYRTVFDWRIRVRGDGATAFDDAVGEVSGAWVSGSAPIDAGFLYIMTDDIARTCELVTREGGEIVEPPDLAAREIIARFRDPAGNVFGLYQERGLARRG
ncbi:MAG: VOC family protein [Gemmatimonadetes bacterium]|nr:VOC family protein [Gemmatimonadota bacterium]